eukprot:TRINITY_DN7011_c0_g1_i6.p1 TRINITY_DN7011_c0_g1~~TRINITY_DN7011_c0_g1_i6.p1  ORF type:complete len:722 (-),score=207.54 TRINITY_DN7011_c0_g1_i6:291-2456(-)
MCIRDSLWRLINTQVKLERKLVGHRKKVNGVVYYAARNRVISAGDDEVLFVWDPNTAKPTSSVPFAHEGAIDHLKWVEEKQLLISCGEDLSIKLWQFEADVPSADAIAQRLSSSAEMWKQHSVGTSSSAPAVNSVVDGLVRQYERALQSCVSALRTSPNLTLENASWHVQALLSAIDERVRCHPVATEEDVYEALERGEAIVMTQLHERVFGASVADKQLDANLAERLERLSFIEAAHLEIPEDINLECASFQEAKEALGRIAEHKVPSKMIEAVVHCCRCIHELIKHAKEQSVMRKHKQRMEEQGSEIDQEKVMRDAMQAAASAGADEFLPIFIYVVLVANPPKLHSCLQYVQRFRLFSKMGSEGGCFFTHLSSAVYFLENLTSSSLAIDPAVFDYYLNGCKVQGLRVGEPAIRSTLFEDEADSDDAVVGDDDQDTGGGLFGNLKSVVDEQKPGWRKRDARNESNDLFSEDTAAAQKDTPRSRAFGSMSKPKDEVLAHLLHAMDDDLESDSLFTTARESRERSGTMPPRVSGEIGAAESLLRELELEGDDDEFDFPTKSSTQEPQNASVSGIALKDVAESLADCDNAAANTWDLDDEDLPTPVQWESPSSLGGGSAAADAIGELNLGEPSHLLSPSEHSPSGAAGESESPGGSSRLSAITAMFEQKIAVAEAERRSQHERARQKQGASENSAEPSGKSAAAKEVFFSDLADSDDEGEEEN